MFGAEPSETAADSLGDPRGARTVPCLGPNQYLNTIDINQVERIEVVRGAGSVLYGSDALGGVVNVITRSAAEMASSGVNARMQSVSATAR